VTFLETYGNFWGVSSSIYKIFKIILEAFDNYFQQFLKGIGLSEASNIFYFDPRKPPLNYLPLLMGHPV